MAVGEETMRLSVSLPRDLHERLVERAELERRSLSNLIVFLLERALAGPLLFTQREILDLEPVAEPKNVLRKTRQVAGAPAGSCIHRVSLTAYCGRCGA